MLCLIVSNFLPKFSPRKLAKFSVYNSSHFPRSTTDNSVRNMSDVIFFCCCSCSNCDQFFFKLWIVYARESNLSSLIFWIKNLTAKNCFTTWIPRHFYEKLFVKKNPTYVLSYMTFFIAFNSKRWILIVGYTKLAMQLRRILQAFPDSLYSTVLCLPTWSR